MKRKKFLTVLVIATMICPSSTIYASEVRTTEMVVDSMEETLSDSGESGESQTEAKVWVSMDKVSLEVNEESFFYVDGVSSDMEISVAAENAVIVEVTPVTAEAVAEIVKEEAPEDAIWYKVKGLEAGETSINVQVEEQVKEIAVSVTTAETEENGDELEQGGPASDGEEVDESQDENSLAPEYTEEQETLQPPEYTEEQEAVLFSEGTYEVGWKEEEDGTRYYINEAGQFYTGIVEIDGVLYYFDDETGYLCKTGQWIDKDDKRYFCNENGVLYRNQFIKFGTTYYYMGNDGSVQKGVFSAEDSLHYADENSGIVQNTSGWINYDGKKFFANEGGVLYQSTFISFGDTYYYMGDDGSVQMGTFKVGSVWYHSNGTTGALRLESGWIEDDGKRYYAREDGSIFVDQFIKFGTTCYYMGSDGSVQKGVFQIDDIIYYADSSSGIIQKTAGWIDYNGKRYFAKEDGTLYSNTFIKFGTTQYYMGSDGSVQKGVFQINNIVYYADTSSGIVQKAAGWIDYDGKRYFAKGDGTLYSNIFIKFGTTSYYMGNDGSVQKGIVNAEGILYYADPTNGIVQKTAGWIEYNVKKYFAMEGGRLYQNQFISFGTTRYYMGSDGSVQKGVVNAAGVLYYADPTSGIIQKPTGWIDYDGKRYFAKEDGTFYSNIFIKFGTTSYYMGNDGSVQKGIVNAEGILYYADPTSGIVQKTAGWIEYNGKKYFAMEGGRLYQNQFISFGTTQYYMGSDGSVQKGQQYINGQWYYFDEDTGILIRKPGWFIVGSYKYYQQADGTLATGYTDIDGIRYYFNSKGALASRVGIDVSYYQGNIDWEKVKAAGVEFVFVRAGYRGYSNGRLVKDSCFDQNMRGALAAGLEVGVYFFSQAINVQEAQEEATFTYNLIKNYDVTFPVAFDAEYATSGRTGRADHLSASTRTLVVNAFCSQIKSYGYTPMLYAGIYFMRDELQMSLLSNYQLWIPRYNSTLGYDGEYKCWQYTSTGRVDGISGNVDMNVWLN